MNKNPANRLSFAAKVVLWGMAFAFALQPHALLACAACYGQSDSPMAKGMNWGIFSLLTVVVTVLGSIAGFFIFLARRSANASAPAALPNHGLPVTNH